MDSFGKYMNEPAESEDKKLIRLLSESEVESLSAEDQFLLVKKANELNAEKVGDIMFNIVSNENVKTYNMMNSLAVCYENHMSDDSFISGMNAACQIFTYKMVPEIAKDIITQIMEEKTC